MIKDLFDKGIAAHLQAGNDAEAGKSGSLRGGNTGMMTEAGDIIGSCAASTYLRMIGINGLSPVTPEKELMFAGGRLNEDHWLAVLKTAYEKPGQVILCEEEIPTAWETDQGIKVTGRPDIVLCKQTHHENPIAILADSSQSLFVVPECGIELKQCMSVNSAYNVLVKREPQLKHLMQTAHYMWQLDCDFELWYTNRNNLDMPSWMEFRKFPKPGTPGTESIGYRYYRMGDINPRTGKPKKHQLTEAQYHSGEFSKTFAAASKITPFVQGFKMQLLDGVLHYQDTSDPKSAWIKTIVTIDNIKRFYNFIGDLEQYGKVPREALNLTATGEKMGWKFSDYSDLGDLDPSNWAGKSLSKWTQAVREKVESTAKVS